MNKFESVTKPLLWFMALLLSVLVTGCGGGGGQDPILGVGVSNISAKAITAYSLNGTTGTINEPAKTISVTVPNGANVAALVATFTSTGASVKIGTAVQTSGTTTNNFAAPVAYTVTAADGSTATYNVTVTVASLSDKAITAYSLNGVAGTINEPAKTIAVTVPSSANVAALVATFSTTGTSVKIGTALQTSATTSNDFSAPVAYTVAAADGSTATYIVTVTVSPISAKAITAYSFVGFSGSPGTVNEAAKTIAVTLPSGTPVTALVANFTTLAPSVKIGATVQTSGALPGVDFTAPVTYRVTAADGTFADYVVTVTVPPASSAIKAITAFSFVGFSGSPGTVNEAAKTIAVTLPSGTPVTSLVANFTTLAPSVKIGTAVQTSGALPGIDFTTPQTYRVTAADGTFADYVVTVSVPPAPSSIKAITAFSFVGFSGSPGTVNEAAKTIAVTLPSGTPVTALVANFTTLAPSVKVGAAVQTSGALPGVDFTAPVTYRVTAADATYVDYAVTVIVTAPPVQSSIKTITAYSFVGFSGSPGTVNEAAKTIAVTLPSGTPVTALVANFTTAAPSVKIGAAVQTSGALPVVDFTTPVTYRVTAADATFVDYVVTVTVPAAPSSTKAITAYSFAGFAGSPGTVNEAAKTIAVTLPSGTPVTALVANFTTVAPSVKIGAAVQTSGALPAIDFTAPVTYRVTAADATFVDYVVTVTVPSAPNSIKAITAYSFVGFAGSPGTVNEAAKTIAVTLPSGTPVTDLVANFTTVAPSVKIGAAVQTSGALPAINFTAPVTYRVTAADASFVDYVVTVTVSAAPSPSGPAAVNLGTAGNFVILAKSAVSTTGTTAVVGDIGLSPSAASFITGFGLIADSTNVFSTSSLVTGKIYAANYAVPSPANMTTAVSDMETAFTDAAGRAIPDFTELYAGDISGRTLVPGLYKWGTGVLITSAGVTLTGGPNDVWIFQIGQDLTVNNSAIITLSGGAQARNVFWQVSGQATLGTAVKFKGNILSQTLISLNTGAELVGRALAQTAVTLNANSVTAP